MLCLWRTRACLHKLSKTRFLDTGICTLGQSNRRSYERLTQWTSSCPSLCEQVLIFLHAIEEPVKTLYTVKLARANLPANAGNFTCSSQVKGSLAQFTCVACSLPVNTGKFTCFEAASTSRRTHANCLRAHVNLLEYHRHFTGSFTCGTHANLPATSMQNCLLLQAKIYATYRQKH